MRAKQGMSRKRGKDSEGVAWLAKFTTVYERPRRRQLQPEHVSSGGEEHSYNTSTGHRRDVCISHSLQVAHSLGTEFCC